MDTVTISVGASQVLAAPVTFKTGSIGFRAVEKVTLDGKRYQANLVLVEIGSKPKSK